MNCQQVFCGSVVVMCLVRNTINAAWLRHYRLRLQIVYADARGLCPAWYVVGWSGLLGAGGGGGRLPSASGANCSH